MNSEVLNTFVSLMELASFTKAAQHLKITQSAVTKRIDTLEAEIGTELLVRNRKSVMPTAKGRVFFSYAKSILELENCALTAICDSTSCQEKLLVGSVSSMMPNKVTQVITSFMHSKPQISVQIENAHSNELLKLLYDDKLDVCFSTMAFRENNYTCTEFLDDEFILVTSKVNNCYPDGITSEELRELPIIQDNCSYIADPEWFKYIYSGAGQKVLKVGVGSFEIPFLLDGIGYGFVSARETKASIAKGELKRIAILDHRPLSYKGYLIYKSATSPNTSLFMRTRFQLHIPMLHTPYFLSSHIRVPSASSAPTRLQRMEHLRSLLAQVRGWSKAMKRMQSLLLFLIPITGEKSLRWTEFDLR